MLAVVISFLCFATICLSMSLPPPRRVSNRLVFSPLHQHSAAPRAERGKSNKQQKPPVPPAVEHITRHYNECVLQPQLVLRLADEAVEDEPIEQKDYRQEDGELDGVEEHIVLSLASAKV